MAYTARALRGRHVKVKMPFRKKRRGMPQPPASGLHHMVAFDHNHSQAETYRTTQGRSLTPHPSPPANCCNYGAGDDDQTRDHWTGPSSEPYPPSNHDHHRDLSKHPHKPLSPTPDPLSSLSSQFNAHNQSPDPYHRTLDSLLRNTSRLKDSLTDLSQDHVTTIYPLMKSQLDYSVQLACPLGEKLRFLKEEYEALEQALKERLDEYVRVRERMEGLGRENEALRRCVGERLRRQNEVLLSGVEEAERDWQVDYEDLRDVGYIGWEGSETRMHYQWRRRNQFVWERRESVADEREAGRKQKLMAECRSMMSKAKQVRQRWILEVEKRKQEALVWWADKVYWYERGKAGF